MKLVRYLALTCLVVVFGCSGSSSPSTSTALNSGGGQAGTLTGRVRLVDSTYAQISPKGVRITLDNTSLGATADELGWWGMTGVPAGSYDVTITKEGCGKVRAYGVSVAGPGTSILYDVTVSVLPSGTPHLDSMRLDVQSGVPDGITYFASGLASAYLFDRSPAIRSDEPHTAVGRTSSNGPGSSLTTMYYSELASAGVHRGDTIYVSACQNAYPLQTYLDPHTHLTFVCAPGPKSNVMTFVMP